jgi:hypothetical protein
MSKNRPWNRASAVLERRRLARAHDAVDVEQRFFAVRVLVGGQRVADVRADIDVVDREGREFKSTPFSSNSSSTASVISSPAST